ncbi:putative ribonuclease H protein [Ananas comosus]|uniref:Putative ribonuclease H protein n=1 Tax=Ananas comosus TaxID=4615 RepID=A0A199UPA3_ANACO|nr:putative ribonuclease H protein [Ananas comosus]
MDKSDLYYLGPRPCKGDRLARILGCKADNLPFCYLGIPLHNKQIRKEDWVSVINRIETRINGWKARLLSQGGRLILVNSVLTSLPLFYLFTFKAPHWVLHRIESLRRAFFWKGGSQGSRTLSTTTFGP